MSPSQALSYMALEEAFKKLENDLNKGVKNSAEKYRLIDEVLAVESDTQAKYI